MDTQNHRPRADLPRGTEGIRTWGAALKYAREKAKYRTPKDLAAATGLAAIDINLWERGMGSPEKKELRRLLSTLPLLVRFAHLPMGSPSAPPGTVIAVRRPVAPPPPPEPPPTEEVQDFVASGQAAQEAVDEAVATPQAAPAPEPAPVAPPAVAERDEPEPVAFAEAMRVLRAQMGLKQGEFGGAAGMAGGDISRYERGASMRQDMYKRLTAAYPQLAAAHVTPPPGSSRQSRMVAPPPARVSGNTAKALQLAEAMDDYQRAKVAYDAAMAEADGASKRQDAAKARVDELMEEMRASFGRSTAP